MYSIIATLAIYTQTPTTTNVKPSTDHVVMPKHHLLRLLPSVKQCSFSLEGVEWTIAVFPIRKSYVNKQVKLLPTSIHDDDDHSV